MHIFYSKPLFEHLQILHVWDEIIEYLILWKKDLPDIPEINFDLNPKVTFEEIKDLSPTIFRRLFSNEEIFKEIVLTLFPEKKTLLLLKDYFNDKDTSIYKNLSRSLETLLSNN